jgi:Archaeal TRASH domain
MFSVRIPMKSRQPWLLVVGLGLLAGCTGEESKPGPPVQPVPSSRTEMKPAENTSPTGRPLPTGKSDTKAPASSPAEGKDSSAPSLEGPKSDAAEGGSKSVKLTSAEEANIKKLPAEEQPAALKQLVCPVSGEHLGSMGTPVKVSAENRTFYLCCKSCQDDVKADPKGVIAKLDKK